MSPGRAFAIVTVTAFVAGGGLVPAASAATLHVSPHRLLRGSTLLPCAAAQPCNLAFALANAGPGDDVAMAPGDYRAPVLAPFLGQTAYTSTLEVKPGVVLHGDPGATLP